jgi:YVTN family beta-propeller protein
MTPPLLDNRGSARWQTALAAGTIGLALVLWPVPLSSQGSAQARYGGPINSQPLALSADDSLLAVCNPDNNSVTFFDVSGDANRKLAEIPVGLEPNGVALSPDGTRAYVANTVSGTVSVISVNRGGRARILTNIAVGTEPYGIVTTPNGTRVYVTNKNSNNVSVIDTRTNRVTATLGGVGIQPRGIAMTNDGDSDDTDETVFISNFLSTPILSRLDGEDDSKLGFVFFFETRTNQGGRAIQLRPMTDSGFKAAGDAIARVAPPAAPVAADFRFTTGAYANQLNNLAVKDRFIYVPNTGASPNGPTRFNVNTQALVHVLEFGAEFRDTGRTINLHKAVEEQTVTPRLFPTQPWAIALKKGSDEGFVVSYASDVLVKVRTDSSTGTISAVHDDADGRRVRQVKVGKNPRGIVINSTDSRAYVMNYVSRDVSVIDLTPSPEQVMSTLRSSALPEPGTQEDVIHIGKELYLSSIGEFDGPDDTKIRGRMSNNGWGSCGSCHPDGLTDNVVWIFAAGPRRTVSQHQDYSLDDPTDQRAFNWSGIFDEQEDFEANIRNVSGGAGLIVGEDGITPDPVLGAFAPPNAGRRQLTVRGVPAWDAIKAFMQFGVRTPISPISKSDPDVIAGEALFRENNCQSCHGGPKWTTSRITHTGEPAANLLSAGQLIGQLKKVGTFNAALKTEVRANGAAPLGNDGYVPPSLMGLHAFPQTFLHNGSAESLETVMANATHRGAGNPGGADRLTDAARRAQLIKFLLSIDQFTTPIEPE